MPAAAVIPAELGMGNFVAVKTFVVTIELYSFSLEFDVNIHLKQSAIKLERSIYMMNTKAW